MSVQWVLLPKNMMLFILKMQFSQFDVVLPKVNPAAFFAPLGTLYITRPKDTFCSTNEIDALV